MIKKILFLFLVFLVVSCSSFKKDFEETKKKKSNALTAIRLLENQNFAGLKCDTSDNQLITRGTINNNSVEFLLDSGASYSFINYSFAKKLRLIDNISKSTSSEVQTAFSSVDKGEKIFIPTLEVQGFKYSNWPVHLIDSPIKKLTIGSDFLLFNNSVMFCKYGILMNSAGSEKADSIHTFLTKNNYANTPLLDYAGNKLPKDIPNFIGITLFIKATINGEEQLMLIDTGAAFTTAFQSHNINLQSGIQQTNLILKDASGKSKKLHVTKVDSLIINNVCLMKDKKLAIVDKDFRIGSSKIYGTIGMDLLVDKNVILDFGNKIMYFEKEY